MFGGRKEKALEELAAVKRELAQKKELFGEVLAFREDVFEQFARMTASKAQMEKDVAQVKENVQHIYELAENQAAAAGDVHNAMIEMNNGVATFDANHSVFLGQIKAQNERVVEIVESNKHFTTPMKCITEMPSALKEGNQEFAARAKRMEELSKDMAILALNAAIEAGRMGETADQFVNAAEEVRVFSEQYEQEAVGLQEQIAASDARIAELEEQVRHLNELLKENNISMGRLYKECMQNMSAYEAGQIGLRDLISESLLGRMDALQQSERENLKIEERILLRIGDIQDELKEQMGSADNLEGIYKQIQQSAEKGAAD
ncbi:MAG: hypothetical protein ACLT3H_01645 [Roseburia sp.]